MNKNEVLDEHKDTWQHNGLSNLRYEEIARRPLDPSARAIKVKVDVGENGHWTDLVCGVEDTQLDTPVEELKTRYSEVQQAKKGRLSSATNTATAIVAAGAAAATSASAAGSNHDAGSSSISTMSSVVSRMGNSS